jgi:hypothetical protein
MFSGFLALEGSLFPDHRQPILAENPGVYNTISSAGIV